MYFVRAACRTIVCLGGGAGLVFFGGVGDGGGDRFSAVSGIAFEPVAGCVDGGGEGARLRPVVGCFPLSFFVGGGRGGTFAWIAASAYDRVGGGGGWVVWVVASVVVGAGATIVLR